MTDPATEAPEPNWRKLRELSERAAALQAAGEMTVDKYEELFEEAVEATNGRTEFAEALTPYAPPEALV